MSGECDKCGGHALDFKCNTVKVSGCPICEKCHEHPIHCKCEEDINQYALQELEKILIRLREIKNYVIEQKELMYEKYPNETHGYQVLHYLHKSLLGFVKEKDDDQV